MAERKLACMIHDDVPSLFEAPLANDEPADVVLLGVPYEGILVGDRHTLYPPGTRPPETFYARFGADQAPDVFGGLPRQLACVRRGERGLKQLPNRGLDTTKLLQVPPAPANSRCGHLVPVHVMLQDSS